MIQLTPEIINGNFNSELTSEILNLMGKGHSLDSSAKRKEAVNILRVRQAWERCLDVFSVNILIGFAGSLAGNFWGSVPHGFIGAALVTSSYYAIRRYGQKVVELNHPRLETDKKIEQATSIIFGILAGTFCGYLFLGGNFYTPIIISSLVGAFVGRQSSLHCENLHLGY